MQLQNSLHQSPGRQLKPPPSRSLAACASRTWRLAGWNTSTGECYESTFKCRSWRHEGACRRDVASADASRITAALMAYPADEMVYMVLGLGARERAMSGSQFEAYADLRDKWGASLAKKLARRFGLMRMVATVEAHRDGWPHVNVILWCPRLAQLTRGAEHEAGIGQGARLRVVKGPKSARPRHRIERVMREMAVSSGFGWNVRVEAVNNRGALGAYLGQLSVEVGKTAQVPVEAPAHFRRIRASKGFLLPSHLVSRTVKIEQLRRHLLRELVTYRQARRESLWSRNGDAARHFRATWRKSLAALRALEASDAFTGQLQDADGVPMGKGYRKRRATFEAQARWSDVAPIAPGQLWKAYDGLTHDAWWSAIMRSAAEANAPPS